MSAKAKKEAGFEEQMQQLESLIEKLEGDNLSLEDSLSAFEQAMELAKRCGAQLKQAQERVSVLMGDKEERFNSEEMQ